MHEKIGKWEPEVVARFEDLCRLLLPVGKKIEGRYETPH
jgi:hypothetical protein